MRKALPFLALVALAGCGGGSSSSLPAPLANGTAKVSVSWPARDGRFIPLAANSVVIDLNLNGQKTSQTLVRGGDAASLGTATFGGLKYGSYTVTIRAYPTTDGTGVAQAIGVGNDMIVTEDQAGTATVSLATTVETVSILPVAFDKGLTTPVSIGAKDHGGAIVLLEAGGVEKATWTVDNTAVAALVGTATTARRTSPRRAARWSRSRDFFPPPSGDLSETVRKLIPASFLVLLAG